MPRPYSIDLRRKVLDAYDRGDGSQRALAARFGLAASTVQSWLDRRRITGSVAPRPSGASSPKLTDDAREVLRQIAADQPDGYAREWAVALAERTGVRVHPSTVWRQARRMGLTRKKRRGVRPSATATT